MTTVTTTTFTTQGTITISQEVERGCTDSEAQQQIEEEMKAETGVVISTNEYVTREQALASQMKESDKDILWQFQ